MMEVGRGEDAMIRTRGIRLDHRSGFGFADDMRQVGSLQHWKSIY